MSRREFLTRSSMAFAGSVLVACTSDNPTPKKIVRSGTPPVGIDTQWPIQRVVYLMLENRSFDNLFGKYGKGSNGTTVGNKLGQEVPLGSCPQWLSGDLPHDHAAAINCINGGQLDNFAGGIYGPYYSYTQFDRTDLPNYWRWADDFVLSDNFFASALGPSHPNHLFFIAGQSGGTIDNPENIKVKRSPDGDIKSWGCDAYGNGVFIFTKDEQGNLNKHSTCFDFKTVGQQLSEHGVDWAIYAADPDQSGYFWNAYNAIGPVFHDDMFHEHTRSVDNVVTDIKKEALPSVTWITPRFEQSDHPPWNSAFSHNWVTDIVNALMASPMWPHTAIFITWDEWGGFYDHVMPKQVDDIGLGFRVPLLTLSPYAAKGAIDHAVGEFSTPLRFISDNWGLPYLTDRIKHTHNFEHVFDFKKNPRKPRGNPYPKIPVAGDGFTFPKHYNAWPKGAKPGQGE
jgi:phospholipase C